MKYLFELLRLLRNIYFNRRARKLGLAFILSKKNFIEQNNLLSKIIRNIESGKSLDEELMGFNGYRFTERIVEYPFFVNWSDKLDNRRNILDVGCVLNNKLILDQVSIFENIWFCNPSVEPIAYNKPIFYHIANLENAFENSDIKFDNITCLSTIEHIGYDNSHYNVYDPPMFFEANDDVFIQSVLKLISLLNESGNLLVSVPFGLREAIRHPVTLKYSSQVFNSKTLKKLVKSLPNNVRHVFSIYKATDQGWVKSDAEDCDYIKYAANTPASGAGAVCLMELRLG